MQQRIGNFLNRGGGGIHRVDRADDDGPVKGTLAIADAGGLEVGHDGEVLPDLALKTVFSEFLAQNRVALAHSLQTVARDRADAANAETGTGERLTVDHVVGKPQLLADHADFVFIEKFDRLDQFEVELFRKTADVVVGFDQLIFAVSAAFNDVGKDCALCKVFDFAKFFGFVLEYVDEFFADNLAFSCLSSLSSVFSGFNAFSK